MKKLLFLVMLLLLVGVWMGINFAKDRPLFSNPFEDSDIRERAKQGAVDVLERSTEAVKRKLSE